MALLVVSAMTAVGWLPTRRLGGDAAIPAMVAGCLISLAGAMMAGWLVMAAEAKMPEARMRTAFLAMVVRLTVVAVCGLAAVLSGLFDRTPLLFWLAAAYVALLPLEVKLAIGAE
jgi:hypothetical protein